MERFNLKNKIAKQIYICIPELTEDFHMLDFSNQIEKYQAVNSWLNLNNNKLAINIEEFNIGVERLIVNDL